MKSSHRGFRRRTTRSVRKSVSNRGHAGQSFFRSSPVGIFSATETTSPSFFQPKLAMGTPGDPYEKEADAVADKVTSSQTAGQVNPVNAISPVQKSDLQKQSVQAMPEEDREEPIQKAEEKREEKPVQKNEENKEEPVQMEAEKKEEESTLQKKGEEDEESVQAKGEEEEEAVQTKTDGGRVQSGPDFVSSQLSQRGQRGEPLPAPVRGQMESSFGTSFSQVKIHTDAGAQQMSRSIGAKAFTHGKDIYFNSGYFAPYNQQGKHLLAHELTHVVQQSGGKQDSPTSSSGNTLHREVELDPVTHVPTGNFLFHPGFDLPAAFLSRLKNYLGDGSLTDDELNRLRLYSLAHRGSVTQAERLLMAAGMDATNVPLILAHVRGVLSLPFANITSANRTHVANIGRGVLSPEYEAATLQAMITLLGGDFETALTQFAAINERAIQEIFTIGGRRWQTQAEDLVAFMEIHNVPAVSVLSAMYNAASDSSSGDQIMAGMVYATASQAGLASASRIAAGSIKVDALIPSALRRLTNNLGGDAMYVPAGRNDRLKADTIYVPTSLSVLSLTQRALIVHELTHANDDEATVGVTTSPQIDLEMRAYRRQAQYIMDQLLATPRDEFDRELASTRRQADSPLFQWAYMVEAKANMARYKDIATAIVIQSPSVGQGDIDTALAMTLANLIQRFRNAILALPQYSGNPNVIIDGLHGESILDHVN